MVPKIGGLFLFLDVRRQVYGLLPFLFVLGKVGVLAVLLVLLEEVR